MSANAQTHRFPKADAEHISNAMSAGPPAISHDATIMAMDGDKMRTIRQGKNEFTCVSDDPNSPGTMTRSRRRPNQVKMGYDRPACYGGWYGWPAWGPDKSPAEPKKPFIMWSGTSYENIMMPIK
jgi:hypothetical protein